jgi:integrase
VRRILFSPGDGPRKTIHLGKMSERAAEGLLYRVECLIESKLTGRAFTPDMAKWVADSNPKLAKKLVRVGLISKRASKPTTPLGPFLTEYLEGRADIKLASKVVRRPIVNDLKSFFGESRDAQTITEADADEFKQWLFGRGLAPATIHKRLQVARSFFQVLRRRKLIDSNPFAEVKAAATRISERQRFVTREEIELVLACPNHDWRLIVALARYGGLRTPSETLSLRWQDVNWETGRIAVQSPKTEHHSKPTRIIPLFPELRPYLERSFELAPEGAVYVVAERFRNAAVRTGQWCSTNLRTTFEKIITRAGLDPWPRLFHNLRASRETELVREHPVQVVTSWLGNTPNIALKHYLMVRDSDFEKAVQGAPEKTAQKTTQQAHAKDGFARNASHAENGPDSGTEKKPPEKQGFASRYDALRSRARLLSESQSNPARI